MNIGLALEVGGDHAGRHALKLPSFGPPGDLAMRAKKELFESGEREFVVAARTASGQERGYLGPFLDRSGPFGRRREAEDGSSRRIDDVALGALGLREDPIRVPDQGIAPPDHMAVGDFEFQTALRERFTGPGRQWPVRVGPRQSRFEDPSSASHRGRRIRTLIDALESRAEILQAKPEIPRGEAGVPGLRTHAPGAGIGENAPQAIGYGWTVVHDEDLNDSYLVVFLFAI